MAASWVGLEGFKHNEINITTDYYKFIQFDKKPNKHYKITNITDGIDAIIEI